MRTVLSAVFAFSLLLSTNAAASEPPNVVATIKPLHGLVAGVMKDVGDPQLLIDGVTSPHSINLRPSQAQLLEGADVVFWIGEELETALAQPIATLSKAATTIALINAPSIETLTYGDDHSHGHEADHKGHGHDHGHSHDHAEKDNHGHDHGHNHSADAIDGHIWLSLNNARAMTQAIADTLSAADPANSTAYQTNAKSLIGAIAALESDVRAQLAPVAKRPFVVFHDAYQYFRDDFDVAYVGALAINPDQPISAARLRDLQHSMEHDGVVCIFSEPQFSDKMVATLAAGTGAKTAVLDPLGSDIAAGPSHYIDFIKDMTSKMRGCLSADS